MKPEGRNPKSERRPKSEGRKGTFRIWWPSAGTFDEVREASAKLQNRRKKLQKAQKNEALRYSLRSLRSFAASSLIGSRISGFGLRPSDLLS
jgi:hypothetical protein